LRWNGPLDPATISSLPAGQGSYALFLSLPEPAHLAVGRLGAFAAGGHQNVYVIPFFGIFDQGTAGAGFVVGVSSNGQNYHGNLRWKKIKPNKLNHKDHQEHKGF
jgi:hypothetical protein